MNPHQNTTQYLHAPIKLPQPHRKTLAPDPYSCHQALCLFASLRLCVKHLAPSPPPPPPAASPRPAQTAASPTREFPTSPPPPQAPSINKSQQTTRKAAMITPNLASPRPNRPLKIPNGVPPSPQAPLNFNRIKATPPQKNPQHFHASPIKSTRIITALIQPVSPPTILPATRLPRCIIPALSYTITPSTPRTRFEV